MNRTASSASVSSTTSPVITPSAPHTMTSRLARLMAAFERLPYDLLALAARFALAGVFFYSGRTKVAEGGFAVSESAIELFADEYRLPLVDPAIAAHLATYAEHLFPLLLVLGLATRFSALALLVMTLVIQIFVYPAAWPTHLTWAACALLLMRQGGGRLALDALLARRKAPVLLAGRA
jgi:putative oxidoreductase